MRSRRGTPPGPPRPGEVDLEQGVDVGRGPPALQHALGDAPAHDAHRFDACAGLAGGSPDAVGGASTPVAGRHVRQHVVPGDPPAVPRSRDGGQIHFVLGREPPDHRRQPRPGSGRGRRPAVPAGEGSAAAEGGAAATAGAVTASPAAPITATTELTGTVSPARARICSSTPATGAGTSASTLSVDISNNGSSRSTGSPTFLVQRTIVPSAIDSPICGISTSVGIQRVPKWSGIDLGVCAVERCRFPAGLVGRRSRRRRFPGWESAP